MEYKFKVDRDVMALSGKTESNLNNFLTNVITTYGTIEVCEGENCGCDEVLNTLEAEKIKALETENNSLRSDIRTRIDLDRELVDKYNSLLNKLSIEGFIAHWAEKGFTVVIQIEKE